MFSSSQKNPCARIIKKGDSKTGNIPELMYIFPVYLHPEFWGQFWSPALRAKVVALEKIKEQSQGWWNMYHGFYVKYKYMGEDF